MPAETGTSMFRHLGLALRVLRERAGLHQGALARKAGIGKSQLSKYENGRELPKLESIEKVLRALETDALSLFYLLDLLGRHRDGLRCLPFSAGRITLSTLLSPQENAAFNRFFDDLVHLFGATVEGRLRGLMAESSDGTHKGRNGS